jgi:SAM-dependent methyltransferase
MSGYDRSFYDETADLSGPSARAVVPAVLEVVHPRSVLDVGCGVGTWLATFREGGVPEILGLDGETVPGEVLRIPAESFRRHDLSTPFRLGRTFDLVTSLEVAEHLPPARADSFLDDLAAHGKVILFSAAVPGQGGTHHFNEQWQSFWIAKFAARGYRVLDIFRGRFWRDPKVAWWYAQNIFLFVHEDALEGAPRLKEALATFSPYPLDIVHPDLFTPIHAALRNPSFLGTAKALPGLFFAAVRRRVVRRNGGA